MYRNTYITALNIVNALYVAERMQTYIIVKALV